MQTSEGLIRNQWRLGMMGSAKAHYDGIVAFSQTDCTEDLKRSACRCWSCMGMMIPCATSAPRSVEHLRNGTLKPYEGLPHGMPATHADPINADLSAFIKAPA